MARKLNMLAARQRIFERRLQRLHPQLCSLDLQQRSIERHQLSCDLLGYNVHFATHAADLARPMTGDHVWRCSKRIHRAAAEQRHCVWKPKASAVSIEQEQPAPSVSRMCDMCAAWQNLVNQQNDTIAALRSQLDAFIPVPGDVKDAGATTPPMQLPTSTSHSHTTPASTFVQETLRQYDEASSHGPLKFDYIMDHKARELCLIAQCCSRCSHDEEEGRAFKLYAAHVESHGTRVTDAERSMVKDRAQPSSVEVGCVKNPSKQVHFDDQTDMHHDVMGGGGHHEEAQFQQQLAELRGTLSELDCFRSEVESHIDALEAFMSEISSEQQSDKADEVDSALTRAADALASKFDELDRIDALICKTESHIAIVETRQQSCVSYTSGSPRDSQPLVSSSPST
mmetsp:Transcript_20170/g.47012  ORF Transcript_20170/g.47012 Transcript_20170/m.47012 type:complete len:398 (+) Transcript_20170:120-1313(+)